GKCKGDTTALPCCPPRAPPPTFRGLKTLGGYAAPGGVHAVTVGERGAVRLRTARTRRRTTKRVTGVEPATLCLASTRSSQLSYTRKSEESPCSFPRFEGQPQCPRRSGADTADRKSTRLNSSHQIISYAVFCLKTKNT